MGFLETVRGVLGLNRYDTEKVPDQPQEASLSEKEMIELVISRAESAISARFNLEGDWATCIAFDQGIQWVDWDDQKGGIVSRLKPAERKRYVTVPLAPKLIQRNVSRATQNNPSSIVAPNTQSPTDERAASEARDLLHFLAGQHNDRGTLQDIVHFCMVATTCFLHQYWDPRKKAMVPQEFDPTSGEPVSFVEAPIGDYCECIVPGPELLLDPNSTKWDLSDARWVIRTAIRSVHTIRDEYGKDVRPDAKDGADVNKIGPFLSGLLNQFNSQSGSTKDTGAIVYTLWEKPTKGAERGRIIECTRSAVLRYENALPYEGFDLPFTPLVYRSSFTSPYGIGLMTDLKGLQMTYNRIMTRILERMEYDKLTIVAPRGAVMGDKELDEQRHMRRVYLDPSMAAANWNVTQPPPINPEWFTMLEITKRNMDEIAGSHEVDRGGTGGGVTAGYAIRLLQEANNTQHATFYQNVERFVAERDKKRIAICSQYYREARQISVPLTAKPEIDPATGIAKPTARTVTFEGLQGGGRTRVDVVPGSGTPKSPEAHNQEIKEFYQLGIFGPPGDPRASKIAIDLLNLSDSDKIHEALDGILEQQMAEIQQQQILAQQAQAATELQAITQGVAATNPPPPKAPTKK